MTENRIGLNDSVMESVVKLVEGSPGAMAALMDVMEHDDGLMALLWLDDGGIYGPDIWVLYKDMCDHDVQCFVDKALNGVTLEEIRETRYPSHD